ncbi:MAG TPA: peptidase domain-containing ABC transporter [Bacteroidales bacterium]|nr:peptidase domain-containing ABC transporter [Bacteroidales bacterium]HQJ82930.1 peptidase domain-containing ABC transporter [Bacteroidales bacterium]
MSVNIRKIKEKALLQHDSTDCGAACLASAIRYFGGESGIERIRKLSGTSQSGTTMLGLYQAAVASGLKAQGYEASVESIKSFKGLLILHVSPEIRYDHYILSFGYEDGRFVLWDPANGLTTKTAEELEKIWPGHKCLSVEPGEGFVFKKEEDKGKRKWLINTIKPDRELLMISILLGLLISALGAVMAIFTQKLIDRILPSGEVKVLLISSVLVFVLLISRVVLLSLRQYILLSQGKSFNIRIVDGFYRSLLGLPKLFFDTRKTGDLVARLNDTMRIQRVISDLISIYFIDIVVLIVTSVLIFIYSLPAGIISVIAIPLIYLLVYRWNKRIISSQNELMTGYAMNESNFINSLRGIAEIKCMNWQGYYSLRNESVFSNFQEKFFSLGKIRVSLGMLTNLAGTLYLIVLLIYSSLKVMDLQMTQGELMAILSLSSTLIPSVMNLALISIPLSEAKVAIARMFEFTRISPEETDSGNIKENIAIEKISLNNMKFRFPGQKLFLTDINLEIEKGQIIALVGESGSGKSTLVNILLRFLIPESGDIIINDIVPVNQIMPGVWRRSVGVVPQDIHIFNGTILENLIPEPSEKEVEILLRLISDYGLESFIEALPLGLVTLVGEDGVKLSGGQKQVIAFLRALINEPDILLIDEGTSGMDKDTEDLMLKMLISLKAKLGILLVTHRISLIKKICDRIYILEDRTIKESGTHYELISSENIYKRYWEELN